MYMRLLTGLCSDFLNEVPLFIVYTMATSVHLLLAQ